jgi:PiT family inorganic phosphate transporter
MATIRNLLTSWVRTLPAAILRSGTLYVIFSRLF